MTRRFENYKRYSSRHCIRAGTKEAESGSAFFRLGYWHCADIKQINWKKQYKAVIQRVFERGYKAEKEEFTRYYGKSIIGAVLHKK